MIEETLERIAVALERLVDVKENPMIKVSNSPQLASTITHVAVDSGVPKPIDTAPQAPEKEKKTTKKKAAKKKEAPVADTTSDVTKAELLSEVRKNVAKTGDEIFALGVFDEVQPGATMNSLREENYEAIYKVLKAKNDE